MVHEMCRKFAEEELMPNAGKWDQKHEFPTEAVDKLVRSLPSFFHFLIIARLLMKLYLTSAVCL